MCNAIRNQWPRKDRNRACAKFHESNSATAELYGHLPINESEYYSVVLGAAIVG